MDRPEKKLNLAGYVKILLPVIIRQEPFSGLGFIIVRRRFILKSYIFYFLEFKTYPKLMPELHRVSQDT